jgi:hypothetical protein
MSAATTTLPDRHGNRVALEGCDRCACGAKYWERDVCVSPACGARHPRYGEVHVTLYNGVYVGTPARPNANPVLSWMRDDDLKHDPWGTAMSWAFAVCEYLWHVALCDDIPEGLGYAPGAVRRGDFIEESYADQALAEMPLDTFTLVQAAKVLGRYLDWCKAAGRDY